MEGERGCVGVQGHTPRSRKPSGANLRKEPTVLAEHQGPARTRASVHRRTVGSLIPGGSLPSVARFRFGLRTDSTPAGAVESRVECLLATTTVYAEGRPRPVDRLG